MGGSSWNKSICIEKIQTTRWFYVGAMLHVCCIKVIDPAFAKTLKAQMWDISIKDLSKDQTIEIVKTGFK